MAEANVQHLGTDDHYEVFQECKKCSAKWYTIGLNLGIPYHILDTIKHDCPNGGDQCMSNMLTKWLQKVDEKCVRDWRSLCQALCDVDKSTADQIAKKHFITYNNKQNDKDTKNDPPSMYPHEMCGCGSCTIKDWKQGRRCEKPDTEKYPKFVLLNPNQSIAARFNHTLSEENELYAMTTDIDERFRECSVKTWSSLRCEVEGYGARNRRGPKQDIGDIVMELRNYFQLPMPINVTSIEELNDLFSKIRVSWFNFKPIHYVATNRLGDLYPEVIQMWEEYVQHFKKYCSERNLKEYSGILFNEENDNVFILEIDECYYEMKLSDIRLLRNSLCRVAGCRSISVHLVAVGTGSLLLSFCYCFDDYINKFNLTPRQLKLLAEIKVCRITSLRDKHNQFVYNDVQSYKILPLEYGVRQAEKPTAENIRFRHRIMKTVSIVEELDLEISEKQLQLLFPFKNIPDTDDAETQTLTEEATEIQLQESIIGEETDLVVFNQDDEKERTISELKNTDLVLEYEGAKLNKGITGKPLDEKGVEDTDDGRSPKMMKGEDEFLAESIRSCKVRDTSVSWDDIVGLENAKRLLEEIVVLPEERPEHFVGLRTPTKGVLLFGPPGNGKTLLAKAVAHESKSTFFNISGATLLSKWVGESEKAVKILFDEARKCQPAVIFIDEIDSLLIRDEKNFMRRFVNQLLQQLDGMTTSKSDRILVMGATNKPKDIDEAALRRFPKRIYIPLPDKKARALALQKLLKNNKHEISDANLLDIARKTENYSFSDMTDLAEDAAHGPRRELPTEVFLNTPDDQIRPIQYKDFISSLSQIRPSVKDETITELEEWNQKYGSHFANSTSPSLEEPKSDSDVSYIN